MNKLALGVGLITLVSIPVNLELGYLVGHAQVNKCLLELKRSTDQTDRSLGAFEEMKKASDQWEENFYKIYRKCKKAD